MLSQNRHVQSLESQISAIGSRDNSLLFVSIDNAKKAEVIYILNYLLHLSSFIILLYLFVFIVSEIS